MTARFDGIVRLAPRGASFGLALALGLVLAGCSTDLERRGHLLTANDLQQVQPGMSKDQVMGLLGTPDSTSTGDGLTYYYISSTEKRSALLPSTEIDRQVVAVYFNPVGSVDHVANYGLQDGKVIDTISRTTPSATGEKSFIEKLFRGVGKKKSLDGVVDQ